MFAPSAKTLIAYQIIAHLMLVLACFTLTPFQWIISFLLYTAFATVGPVVTYHRLLSHKSFKCPAWFEKLGSIIGCIGGISSPLAWVAIHREHHRFTDTEKDPHSPENGWLKVQFGSMLHRPNLRYVPDLLRSKFQIKLHELYWVVNIAYLLTLSFFGLSAVLVGYFVPTLMVWHGGSLINTVNHTFGYRSYETADKSTNHPLTGVFVAGEGWHNNHHAEPANPKFGRKWYEIDLGWYLIKLVRTK